MSSWPSAKARRVFASLKRIGWRHDRTVGSHKIMKKDGWADYPFSFHDSEELGPAILAKVFKKTGLQPKDLLIASHAGHMSRWGKRLEKGASAARVQSPRTPFRANFGFPGHMSKIPAAILSGSS
jgi:predicted RNA binding protein YcfA (HicA-like mRNA interferase family)